MLVSDALDHMLEMGQNVKSRVSKAREFADSIPGDLGKEISELRNWHTTQTEENDYEVRTYLIIDHVTIVPCRTESSHM